MILTSFSICMHPIFLLNYHFRLQPFHACHGAELPFGKSINISAAIAHRCIQFGEDRDGVCKFLSLSQFALSFHSGGESTGEPSGEHGALGVGHVFTSTISGLYTLQERRDRWISKGTQKS